MKKNKNEIRKELADYIDKQVRVTANENGVLPGDGFPTGLMVQGKLEGHPEDKDAYRVVVNDCNYAYFRTENVDCVNWIASVATIVITIPDPE